MKAREIIKKFGGIRPMATALGLAPHTRVQQWYERESIPLKHAPAILNAARKRKISLRMVDFFEDLGK